MRICISIFISFTLVGGLLAKKKVVRTKSNRPRTSHLSVSYEILGAGVLGGLTASYGLFDLLATPLVVSLNMGYLSNQAGCGSCFDVTLVPGVFVSALYGNKKHFLEATSGIDYAFGVINVAAETGAAIAFENSNFTPVVGVGYRFWPHRGGFTFRAMYYLFFGFESGAESWMGLSFGYAFKNI